MAMPLRLLAYSYIFAYVRRQPYYAVISGIGDRTPGYVTVGGRLRYGDVIR